MSNRHLGKGIRQLKDRPDDLNQHRDLRRHVTEGLLYTHSRLNANSRKTLEVTSFL